jgi:excisionase family DNA binding protein
MIAWQRFILEHGWRTPSHELAAVLGRSIEEVLRIRETGACSRQKKTKRFVELFSLWRGRTPRDDEWPMPRKAGRRGAYEWQAPDLAVVASLVGRLGKAEISKIMTERLRKRTGDRRAVRSHHSVQMAINHRLGMVTTDVVGGMTIAEAGREVGSRAIIYQCIRSKQLRPFRVGRLWVIPRASWEAWKKTRIFPPKGYVQLSKIRRPLGIRSDKLSEWARAGYIPTAVRCNPFGLDIHSTRFGTWFIDPKLARKLVADRRAGRPMPWHGKPEPGNLAVTWRKLRARLHPKACSTCAQIWGPEGAPHSYDDYLRRYPPLALGAKRHLTRKWTPGMTPAEAARFVGCGPSRVARAIANGVLSATRRGRRIYLSRTDATHWRARRCPTGDSDKCWISLATASKQYLFTRRQLRRFIADRKLLAKIGTNGPMRGETYVSRHMCGQLRQAIGFSEDEAARRVGVSIERLRILLHGCQWRDQTKGIPLATVRALQQRYESQEGYTLAQAAAELGVSEKWIHDRKLDGTIRISRTRWDRRRIYISKPQFKRLLEAKRHPVKRERFGANWLFLSAAATEAGVSNATLHKWSEDGEVKRRRSRLGWRYHRRSVRARARLYWQSVRFRRAVPPVWIPPGHASAQLEARAA